MNIRIFGPNSTRKVCINLFPLLPFLIQPFVLDFPISLSFLTDFVVL